MKLEGSRIATCPDDELIAAVIENRVSEDQRERLEQHLATCATCLDVLAATLPVSAAMQSAADASERSTVHEPSGLRPRLAFPWGRWAIAAGILIAVGGSLLIAGGQGPIGQSVTPLLTRLGTKLLGVPLRASSGAIRLGDRMATCVLTLHQVRIGHDPQPRVSVDEIRVTLAPTALLTHGPLVTELRVTRPNIELTGPGLGESLALEARRAIGLAPLATTSRINVVEARLVLPGPGAVPLVMEAFSGGIEPTESGARLVVQGRVAGGAVDVVGALVRENHDLMLTIGGRVLDASELAALSDRLQGVLDLRLDVKTVGDNFRMNGRIAIRDGHLVGQGVFDLLHLDAASRTILNDFDPTFAGGDLPFDDARAIFAWRDGTWRFSRIFVTSRGVIAGGHARVTSRGELNGRGMLRVPAELVAALQPHQPVLTSHRDRSGAATLPFGITGFVDAPKLRMGTRNSTGAER